jgi:hypothetical protein
MSISAIDTIDEHNRPIDRTPLTAREVALNAQLHRDAEKRLSPPPAARGTGGYAPFEAQPAERSRVREQA